MEIHSSKFVISNSDVALCPKGNMPEYAFIGRSNVGKSSLINMLARRKKLAMTSSQPGKTMLINHFLMNEKWYLVDLPGYGFARRGKSMRKDFGKLITNYIMKREQMTLIFVLIDVRHKPQKIDVDFIAWLGEEGIPLSIVFTKIDKLKKPQVQANVALFQEQLSEMWEEMPPMFLTSSSSRTGSEELLSYIDDINESLKDQK